MPAQRFPNPLTKNVLYLVEESRAAFGRLVFHFQRSAQRFHQLALVAGQFRRREHSHVIIQIAFAAATRIGQSMALDAEHRATLRAFGNLQLLFPAQSRHRKFRAERGLRNAHWNRAIKIRAAPLKVGVLLYIQHHIKIAARPAIRARFAFTRHTQTRSAIDTRGNAKIDRLMALDTALPAAVRATLLDILASALACRASAGNGEEPLLVRKLPAPAAALASACAGSGFRTGSVTGAT